jgi:hypothetical protein
MNDLFTATYGVITPQVIFQNVTAQEQTGDMHIMVTSYSEGLVSKRLPVMRTNEPYMINTSFTNAHASHTLPWLLFRLGCLMLHL